MPKERVRYFIYFIVFIFVLIVARLFILQIVQHKFFIDRAQSQRQRIIPIAGDRGDIYDRDGRLLATSIDTFSVYVNPKIFTEYATLESMLGGKIERFSEKKLFAWVKRKIPPELAAKIKAMKMKGVAFLPEKKRIYPKGRFAAQLIGFVGLDNEGLSGIELGLEDYLKGEESSIVTESDPAGYELLTKRESKKKMSYSGASVYLTIDESVQYFAERELEKIVKEYSAVSGLMIVLDTQSGDILALAGKPDFNPNFYSKGDPKSWRCRAIDVYEPGSTFKTITAAAGLDTGAINLDTKLKAMDSLEIGGKVIKNSHDIKWDGPFVSVAYMLEQSINTAVAQVSMKMGKDTFYKKIMEFGFGGLTGLGIQGESRGIVRHPSTWSKPDIAMMSFGQSIAVTPIQLCAAYMAIANDGVLIKPQLIKKIASDDESFIKTSRREEVRRALSKKAAEETIKLLEGVCLNGSGRKARLDHYSTGGKTGTAQKAIEGGRGYMQGRFISSFIGFAPLTEPKILCLVLVDEPKGVIWGETVAGPGFKNVVEQTLRYLNVRPDVL